LWSWQWAPPGSTLPTTRYRTSRPTGRPRAWPCCFPDPNGLALGRDQRGAAYLFSANGGTNDVSVIDVARALRGDPAAEIARVPTQLGPWGITATPDGRHVIVSNGGSQRDGSAGNTAT
jgi:YVTN family beta-propeller protein